MPVREIESIKDQFIKHLSPKKIYLFGSYVDGSFSEDSDFDFYIVMDDSADNLSDIAAKAYKSIRYIKQHPVDIIVGTDSRFEERKEFPSVEKEVYQKGVLLYGGRG